MTKGRGDLPARPTPRARRPREGFPDLKYTPKAWSAPSPLTSPIRDAAEATRALFEDLGAQLAPTWRSAPGQVAHLHTAAGSTVLGALRRRAAATGTATSTERTLQDVRARLNLIADELDRLISRLEHLSDLAGEPVARQRDGVLRPQDERAERDPEDGRLPHGDPCTVENGRRIAQALGRTGETGTSCSPIAVARDAAQQAYDRRYNARGLDHGGREREIQ